MIYLIAGIIIITVVATDVVYTVLSSNGAGYLSKFSMERGAALFQKTARLTGSRNILKFAGVSLLSGITIVWIGLLWLGVFLVFYSDWQSVFDSKTEVPASLIDRVYYSGYLLSTLGNGDFAPATGVWQIVTVLLTFSGFIFLTTGITYFVSILSAVTEKRQAASSIFSLGTSGEEIAATVRNLHESDALMSEVSSLKNSLVRLTLNHSSYPISHYFFSTERNRSVSVASAALNDALERLRPDEASDEKLAAQLAPLRRAFEEYLQMLAERFLNGVLPESVTVNQQTIKEQSVREKIIEANLYSDVWRDEPPRNE